MKASNAIAAGAVAALAVVMVAVGGYRPASPTPAASPTPGCHYRPGGGYFRGTGDLVLPDPACTPGALDPRVTQANIASTICVPGYTATVRPPSSVTGKLKRQQMAAYGAAGPASAYEEDHLVSLELGGAPSDPRNLWPEPGKSPNPKDRLENYLHGRVCSGAETLAQAQREIATDWVAAYLLLA